MVYYFEAFVTLFCMSGHYVKTSAWIITTIIVVITTTATRALVIILVSLESRLIYFRYFEVFASLLFQSVLLSAFVPCNAVCLLTADNFT